MCVCVSVCVCVCSVCVCVCARVPCVFYVLCVGAKLFPACCIFALKSAADFRTEKLASDQ